MKKLEGKWKLYLPFGKYGGFTYTTISAEGGVIHCLVEIHEETQGTGFITQHSIEKYPRDFRPAEYAGPDELRKSVAAFADACVPYAGRDPSWKEKDWKDRFLALLRSEGVFDPQPS